MIPSEKQTACPVIRELAGSPFTPGPEGRSGFPFSGTAYGFVREEFQPGLEDFRGGFWTKGRRIEILNGDRKVKITADSPRGFITLQNRPAGRN